jgi:hypothetical protein
MTVHVRPQARFASAMVAAGLVSTASLLNVPGMAGVPAHPLIDVDVAYASAVTNALYGVGDGVGFLSSMVGIHADATISLPFEASLAVLAAAQNPTVAPNVLSYLVQRFVNPAVGDPIHAYPYDTEQAFAVLATLFPAPLGPSAAAPGLINDARLAFADVFNSVLGQLPDPLPGYDAVQDVMNDTVLGGTIVAGQLAVRAPLYAAWNIANYLGYLPANVEASVESAVQTPDQIPGLASNLVYGLLSPDSRVGLFGQLLDDTVNPATWLPAPIGQSTTPSTGLANQTRAAIDDVTDKLLSVLPKPVKPVAEQTPPAELPTGKTVAFGTTTASAKQANEADGDDSAATPPVPQPSGTKQVDLTQANAKQSAAKSSDSKQADAKTTSGTSKAKHRKSESIKDRVTRALTGADHTKRGGRSTAGKAG